MITAIETRYAGHRFRSRLEARWAVFFDASGIQWQYEPQGYVVRGIPYLPDFWLPTFGLWVEVKGQFRPADSDRNIDEWTLLQSAARPGGIPPEPGTDEEGWPEILVLGEIPRTTNDANGIHTALGPMLLRRQGIGPGYQTEPIVGVYNFQFQGKRRPVFRPGPMPAGLFSLDDAQSFLVGKCAGPGWPVDDITADAYSAALSARFEHGENPERGDPWRPARPGTMP